MILILGDRTANVDNTWYHWPCNIDIRIDKIIIGISCNSSCAKYYPTRSTHLEKYGESGEYGPA